MSESDLPIDPAITIQAETSLVDPDTCKFTVSRTVHPGGPFFFDDRKRARGSPLVERLFALPGVAYVLIAGNVVTVGKEPGASWSGLRAGDRNGSPDATAHGNTGHPRGYCQRRHTRADRRREPGSRSATPGPGSQPFHRCPRRADLDRRRPGREPLHRHERRVPGMLGIKGDPAPGVRGDAAQGRAGDREYRRHDGPRSGEYAVLQPHRVEPGSTKTGAPVAMSTRVGCQKPARPVSCSDAPAGCQKPAYGCDLAR